LRHYPGILRVACILVLLASSESFAFEELNGRLFGTGQFDRDGQLWLTPFMAIQDYEIDLSSSESDASLEYQPNIAPDVGLRAAWGGVGLSASYRMPVSSEDRRKKGATSASDFKFDYFVKEFGADIGIQQYRGFYLSESAEDDENESDQSYETRPDLKVRNLYINTYYLPNIERVTELFSRYNLNAAPIIGLSFDSMSLDTSSTLVPSAYALNFVSRDASIAGAQVSGSTASIGAGGGWGRDKTRISMLMLFGRGLFSKKHIYQNEEESRWTMVSKNALRLKIESVGETWIYGMALRNYSTEIPLSASILETTVSEVILSLSRAL
jgi:hypothetical protein